MSDVANIPLVPISAAAKTGLPNDDARWAAVIARNKGADGQFVTGVRTTGIYCKPSCPARLPNRENVQFFGTPGDARDAGFRACKRCLPDRIFGDDTTNLCVAAAARMIDDAIARQKPTPLLGELADKAGFSPFHFHRLFKQTLGVTPKAYGRAARSQSMQSELHQAVSVTQAIHGAGYSSTSRFYETAQARLGMAAKVHLKGGVGEEISFAITACSLGFVLVAATRRGICAVNFGATPEDLAAGLEVRFPQARLSSGDVAFDDIVSKVIGLVEAPGIGAALPLDVRGTAFQERVWQALQAIPAGHTATYSDIAARIGAPKAMRAVAGACAANPVAVIIPCHRVVRANGDLSGYRWGVLRKAELLKRETAR